VRQITYNKPLGTKRFRSSREAHGLAVNIAFLTASQLSPTEVGTASLDLGKLRPGYEIFYRTPYESKNEASKSQTEASGDGGLATVTAAPATTESDAGSTAVGDGTGPQGPAGQEEDEGATEDRTLTVPAIISTSKLLPITSRWVSLSLTDNPMPVTVWVQVVDTQDPNRFLSFLGEVLDETKVETAALIKTEVVPGEKERVRLEEANNNLKKVNDYYTAFLNAETKIVDYRQQAFDEQGNPRRSLDAFGLAIGARGAQEQANIVAIAAGRYAPYSSLIDPIKHRPAG
jgi:hypothetical protein